MGQKPQLNPAPPFIHGTPPVDLRIMQVQGKWNQINLSFNNKTAKDFYLTVLCCFSVITNYNLIFYLT